MAQTNDQKRLLSKAEIEVKKRKLGSGWQVAAGKLNKTFDLANYDQVMETLGHITDIAKQQNHHPTICFDYKTISIETWSHDVGGLSERDFTLAKEIDQMI